MLDFRLSSIFLFSLSGTIWRSLAAKEEMFLSIPKKELCESSPHLSVCQEHSSNQGESIKSRDEPPSLLRGILSPSERYLLFRAYPTAHAKDSHYCSDLRSNFAWTCMPSKSLRLDLVQFCKEYSAFCHVPNYHRLPGPRLGGATGGASGYGGLGSGAAPGTVGVSGGFGIGLDQFVPGLEVGVNIFSVNVGPFPGMGDGVGVNTGLNILGASSNAEAFRRGMSDRQIPRR